MFRLSVLAMLSTLVFVGCASHQGSAAGEVYGVDPSAGVVSVKMMAHLHPTIPASRIYGEAAIRPGPKAGKSHASFEIRSAPVGAHLPWVIRTGRCDESAPVELGAAAQYRPIDVRGDGTGSANQELDFAMPAGRSLHIAVFASQSERNVVVACGELLLAS